MKFNIFKKNNIDKKLVNMLQEKLLPDSMHNESEYKEMMNTWYRDQETIKMNEKTLLQLIKSLKKTDNPLKILIKYKLNNLFELLVKNFWNEKLYTYNEAVRAIENNRNVVAYYHLENISDILVRNKAPYVCAIDILAIIKESTPETTPDICSSLVTQLCSSLKPLNPNQVLTIDRNAIFKLLQPNQYVQLLHAISCSTKLSQESKQAILGFHLKQNLQPATHADPTLTISQFLPCLNAANITTQALNAMLQNNGTPMYSDYIRSQYQAYKNDKKQYIGMITYGYINIHNNNCTAKTRCKNVADIIISYL